MDKEFKEKPLLISVFVIAICSIVYELIIGGISSYLLGDSIKQFSIVIGLYMSAMGIGSYMSKYIKKNLFDFFIWIELSIGFLGGISAALLFYAYAYSQIYALVMYAVIIMIGGLVGLEIPILTRILEEYKSELRVTIANVLSFDYIGALIGSLAFPLILLPQFGFIVTSFFIGFINLLIALMVLVIYKQYISKKVIIKLVTLVVAMIILVGMFRGDNIAKSIDDRLYRDQIIFSKRTLYQKIVVTKHKDDIRLFLDGNIQFSSADEYRYHEALVHPAMGLVQKVNKVLILGGGDGLVAREVLKYRQVKKITLVDIDKEMVDLCKNNAIFKGLNKDSLSNKKMNIICDDAYKFLENNKELYDVVIVDLPDPNNESLNKLYTNVFYRMIKNSLKEDGAMVVQSTSPYYASKAFWCINKTIKSEGFYTYPYHTYVPAFGDWGFQLATINKKDIKSVNLISDTKFLNREVYDKMFAFAKDEYAGESQVEINTIQKPCLVVYYYENIAN